MLTRIMHCVADLASCCGVIWSSILKGELGRACADAPIHVGNIHLLHTFGPRYFLLQPAFQDVDFSRVIRFCHMNEIISLTEKDWPEWLDEHSVREFIAYDDGAEKCDSVRSNRFTRCQISSSARLSAAT